MKTRTGLVAALLTASATAAFAVPVRHAGEWQTVIDGGQPLVVCFQQDRSFDQATLSRPMARMGAACRLNSLTTLGPATSYALQCTIRGAVMTTTGTVVANGPDAFTNTIHSHGGMMPMPDGRMMPLPDRTMTVVSRRLGPCRPGDRVDPY